MKKILFAAALAAACSFGADADLLTVTLNDGTKTSFPVDNIKEVTFTEETIADTFAGTYSGMNDVSINNQWTYSTGIDYVITANQDGTINLQVPEYTLTGTVMGDMTIGAYTVSNIAYDEASKSFVRDYSQDGISLHVKAVKDGKTSLDGDYTMGEGCNVVIEKTDEGLRVVNAFKMGSMPFLIVATFTQSAAE